MAITVQVPLVVEMDDAQVDTYVGAQGLPFHDGPLRVKGIVEDVQAYVLNSLQESPAFGSGGADVSLKRR